MSETCGISYVSDLTRALEVCSRKNLQMISPKIPLLRIILQRELSRDITDRTIQFNASLATVPQQILEDDVQDHVQAFEPRSVSQEDFIFDLGYQIVQQSIEIAVPIDQPSDERNSDVQSDFNIWGSVSNLFTNEDIHQNIEEFNPFYDLSDVVNSPYQNIWNTNPFYNSLPGMCFQQNIWNIDAGQNSLSGIYQFQNIW
jgi:hypothetical protein